jgi:hypothetical protein
VLVAVRWLVVALLAACTQSPPADLVPVVDQRSTLTAMASEGDTLYWATGGYPATAVVWEQTNGDVRVRSTMDSNVTSMAALDGVVYLAGAGGTQIIGAGAKALVTRSPTGVDVVDPVAQKIRALYTTAPDDAVGIGAGRVAIGTRTYALDSGALVEYASAQRPVVVLPTRDSLSYVDTSNEWFADDRSLGHVEGVRWLIERGDELWAISEVALTVAHDGTVETFEPPAAIRAVACTGDRIYVASGTTIWRLR